MYQKILHFIKYNNAFTIALMVFFLGFGVSFAASPDVREGVYGSTETIVSVDNSAIVSADLGNFNFNLRISSITEDDKNYYATYSYQTLLVENSVWQQKEVEKTLTVSKEALAGKDLGLYVARELGENMNYELSYLQRVQKLEKEKGESPKIVATEYSGLIGKLLDPKEEMIEGYTPVIPEPEPETQTAAAVQSSPESVIVSTVHIENSQTPPPQSTSTPNQTSSSGGGSDNTQTEEPATEQASTTPSTQPLPDETVGEPEPEPEPEATSTPEQVPLPAPEDMIDEELVQEVVEELLQQEEPAPATPAPEPEQSAAPAAETAPEPTQ